jgi:hypothetical protein
MKYTKRYYVLLKVRNIITSDFKKTSLSISCRNEDNKKYVSYSFLSKLLAKIKYELGFYFYSIYYLQLKLDFIFNFDEINNVVIEKWKCNIKKGLVGMNRDVNLLLVRFLYSETDAREVYCFYFVIILLDFLC